MLLMEIMPLVFLYVQQSYWLNRLCLPRFNTSQRFFHEGHVPLLCHFKKKKCLISWAFEQHFCVFRNQPASARHCERGWIWGKGCQVNWRDIWQWLIMSYVHQDFWVPSCLSLCVCCRLAWYLSRIFGSSSIGTITSCASRQIYQHKHHCTSKLFNLSNIEKKKAFLSRSTWSMPMSIPCDKLIPGELRALFIEINKVVWGNGLVSLAALLDEMRAAQTQLINGLCLQCLWQWNSEIADLSWSCHARKSNVSNV